MIRKTSETNPHSLRGQCDPNANTRYPRSVKNPARHGLCVRDYDSHHPARAWPSATEYQHAYCSNYTPPVDRLQQHQQQQQQRFDCLEQYMRPGLQQCRQQQQQQQCQSQCQRQRQPSHHHQHHPHQDQQASLEECVHHQLQQRSDLAPHKQQAFVPSTGTQAFALYDPTPRPHLDKHYRGAHYVSGEPLGVQVPEERTKVRQTLDGPVRISCEEDMSNIYLPLYRYKDWAERSELEVWRDCNTQSAICSLPEAPTQFWDFYNEVRMHRPAKQSQALPKYQTCRALPIPRDTDIGNEAVHDPCAGHYGKFQNYKFEAAAFQASNLCRC